MKELKRETVIMHGVILLMIIVNAVVTYFVIDYKVDNVSTEVIKKYLAIEYDKVGGMENYVKVTNATREQAIAWAEQYEGQIDSGNTNTTTADSNTPAGYQPKNMSVEEASEITGKSIHMLGKKNATLTVIEYSDLECPYCKKFHESGVVEKVLEDYPDDVNTVFKQFPLKMHPGAQMQSEATLCVGDLAGSDKYYEFITKVFSSSQQNGNSFTAIDLADLGASIGVDKAALMKCISTGRFKDEVTKQTQEGINIFGVESTPSSVVINNKTGDWEILPGAYGYSDFKNVIDYLLQR